MSALILTKRSALQSAALWIASTTFSKPSTLVICLNLSWSNVSKLILIADMPAATKSSN